MSPVDEKEKREGDEFKFEDRRPFSLDGSRRSASAPVAKTTKTSAPVPALLTEGSEPRPATSPAVLELVEFLSGTALVQLGAGPEGGYGPADPHAARQLLQILEVLRTRLKGRLSEEEERHLEARIYEIQMVFVEKSRAPVR